MGDIKPVPLLVLLCLLAPAPCPGQEARDDIQMQPGRPAAIFVAPGHATTLVLRTDRRISAISLASPVLSYKYDKALNQLEITPTVRTAGVGTNLNLRIGPDVYVLQVTVVDDVRVQYARTLSLGNDPPEGDETALGSANPLKPESVDIVGAAKAMERAESDPVFRGSRPDMRIESLGRCYLWNDCLIALDALAQFAASDMLVFRVQWVNRTGEALYLDPTQYGLLLAGRRIPVIARYKVGVGAVIYPGQLETVYLAVQGYRLSRHNDWELGLPPDVAAVGQLLAHGP